MRYKGDFPRGFFKGFFLRQAVICGRCFWTISPTMTPTSESRTKNGPRRSGDRFEYASFQPMRRAAI